MSREKNKNNEKLSDGIARRLVMDIEAGVYPVDSSLPPELQLMKDMNVSRFTIREAMTKLTDWGLVERRRRIGTRVIASRRKKRYGLSLQTQDELLSYLGETHLHVVGHELVSGKHLSSLVDVDEDQKWWKVDTYRTIPGSDLPLSWTEIYLPEDFKAVIEHIGSRRGSTFQLLEEYCGEIPTLIRQTLSGTTLPVPIAKQMKQSPQMATLKFLRNFYNVDDRLIEVALSYYPEGSFEYKTDLQLET